MFIKHSLACALLLGLAVACIGGTRGSIRAQEAVRHVTWRDYLGGADSSHYSALDEINRTNVRRLEIAWQYPTGDEIPYAFNSIVVDGVMYVMAKHSSIVALDATKGKELWSFDTGQHRHIYGGVDFLGKHGINYWESRDRSDRRLLIALYVPLGSPTYDFYGADRAGDNLFSDSLVALDARTGKRLWHRQLVHHDLWDYDLTAAPQLLAVRHNGKAVDVVAQATKQGFLYVFDRLTGESLWPIEERSVPKSDVPGETASPRQPFNVVPPPFSRQSFTAKDINRSVLTPQEQAKWRDLLLSARNEGIYTPPSLKNTVEMPGNRGGANWGKTAVDPATGTLYVVSMDVPAILKLMSAPVTEPSDDADATPPQRGRTIYEQRCALCHGAELQGRPPAVKQVAPPATVIPQGAQAEVGYRTGYGLNPAAIQPPWSTITAYDLN